MDLDSSRSQELIDRPGESLSVELKRWIDPDSSDGIAKIVMKGVRSTLGSCREYHWEKGQSQTLGSELI